MINNGRAQPDRHKALDDACDIYIYVEEPSGALESVINLRYNLCR